MNQALPEIETRLAALDLLDHHGVDWKRVQRTAYLIHQHLRYEYPGPIDDLHQRLMIIPPHNHGDQRLVLHHLDVSVETVEQSQQQDAFENVILNLYVPHIEYAIDFEAWIVVERHAARGPQHVSSVWLTDPRLLAPSALTQPDESLRQVAAQLLAEGHQGIALAQHINA